MDIAGNGMVWWVLGAAEEAYAFLVSSSLPPLKFETCGSLCSIETLHLSSVAMNPGGEAFACAAFFCVACAAFFCVACAAFLLVSAFFL